MEKRKVVIIGSGPAGYTAAIYCARANLSPVLFEGFFSGTPGGQLMTTTDVENYPGFPEGITGPELMDAFRKQALRFGADIISEDVVSVTLGSSPFVVKGANTSLAASSLIIATGATAKRLDVVGAREGEFWQKGVTACAVCDGAMPLFRNKELYVIGGGDTAVEEALFLTKYGAKVYLVHRRDTLRASKIMAARALSHPKIEVLWDRVLVEVKGESVVGSVVLENVKTKEKEERPAGGVFFAIGHQPNTTFLQSEDGSSPLGMTKEGYLKVQPGTSETQIEGIFAAGDVQDARYRQAITAAGSGCMAAIDAERWLTMRESV